MSGRAISFYFTSQEQNNHTVMLLREAIGKNNPSGFFLLLKGGVSCLNPNLSRIFFILFMFGLPNSFFLRNFVSQNMLLYFVLRLKFYQHQPWLWCLLLDMNDTLSKDNSKQPSNSGAVDLNVYCFHLKKGCKTSLTNQTKGPRKRLLDNVQKKDTFFWMASLNKTPKKGSSVR